MVRLKKVCAFVSTMVGLALLMAGLTGCGTGDPNTKEQFHFPGDSSATPAPISAMQSSVLRVNDMITITFSDVPNPPGLQEIRSRIPTSGMLTLHYNVQVSAAGKTIPELEKEIREAYVPRLFKQLTAIVRSEERFFFVGGEVKTPNRYPLQADLTVLRAIDAAGSFTDFANRRKIELRRENGQRFFIDEKKAKENPALDLPVMANDHIIVKRSIW
jgi:protein involved in polysaccharide export with SLBB domain